MKFNKRKHLKIRTKFAFYFFLFTFVILLILWLCQTVLLDDIYRLYKTESVKRQADTIISYINKESFVHDVELYSQKYGTSIVVTDSRGDILTRTVSGEYSYLITLSREKLREQYELVAQKGGESQKYMDNAQYIVETPEGITRVVARNQKLLYIKQAVVNDSSYMVLIERDFAPVTDTIETLKFELIIITGLIIVLSVLMVIFISSRITKPIIKTNETAKKLAQGEFPKDFDNKGYREIAELNETLKYASNELERVDKLSNDIIANVSHDLRTPLTMISGYAQAMRDIPGESGPENLQIIIDESDRLKNLVNQLLFLSKLKSGANKLQMSRFNITEETKEIVARINKMVEQDGYKVTFAYIEKASVYADRERLGQVIYNLIANAIAYTGEDCQVLVRQTVSKREVKIEVVDSGKGIEADMIPYVWKRYYKNPYAKTHYKGVGVGLSIVKGILDLHNAEYGVESEVGKGSNFWFKIKE